MLKVLNKEGKRLIESIYGNLKLKKRIDYLLVPLKILYFIFTLLALLILLFRDSVFPIYLSDSLLSKIILHIILIFCSILANAQIIILFNVIFN